MLMGRGLRGWMFILLIPFLLTTGCSKRGKEDVKALITPEINLSATEVPLGYPLDINYQWMIGPQVTPLKKDYTVFVHFLDQKGKLLFTDDHTPPLPTSQWQPGRRVEYERTLFLPLTPIMGDIEIRVGLYDIESGVKLTLAGEDKNGSKAYLVGRVKFLPEDLNSLPVYKEGWYDPEVVSEEITMEWMWSQKKAEVAFINPRRDAILYFHAQSPAADLGSPQQITLYLNDEPLDSWQCTSSEVFLRKIAIEKERLGQDSWIDIGIEVDKVFIPFEHGKGEDKRELGVRIYNLLLKAASVAPAARK